MFALLSQKFVFKRFAACTTALSLLAGTAAWAQSNQDRNPDYDSSQSRDNRGQDEDWQDDDSNRQRGDSARQDDRAGQRDSRQGDRARQGADDSRQVKVRPVGWVRIASDYDNDGEYDHFDTIYYYDLQAAQNRSDRRARDGAARQSDRQAQRRSDDRSSQGERQRMSQRDQRGRITGEVRDIRTIRIDGERHLVAKITNDEGRSAKAYLGARDDLRKLDLQDGDRIRVEGVRGRINGKTMLMAQRITANDQTVTNRLKRRSRRARELDGRIVSKQTRSFRGRDGQYVVADVRTDQGRTVTVNLGRKQKVDQLDLQEGDEVSLVACDARIGGRAGMAAERVSANGESITTDLGRRNKPQADSSS